MLHFSLMWKERCELYKALEERLGGKVISYLTSDRPAFETTIDFKVIEPLTGHLEAMGEVETLVLFLCTRGGDTSAAWDIINRLRLYCGRLIAIIPEKAHSAGTIIAIGADSIMMTRKATLGPIDPHETNPLIPKGDDGVPFPVSVEAVQGYIDLAVKELGVKDPGIILTELSSKIHPLVLGQAYRSRAQVGTMARKLLGHQIKDTGAIERTASFLCGGCGSHDYTINRREAREDLSLSVEYPDHGLERLIDALYSDFRRELMGPALCLTEREDVKSVKSGFVESLMGSSYYSYDYQVLPAPSKAKLIEEGWH